MDTLRLLYQWLLFTGEAPAFASQFFATSFSSSHANSYANSNGTLQQLSGPFQNPQQLLPERGSTAESESENGNGNSHGFGVSGRDCSGLLPCRYLNSSGEFPLCSGSGLLDSSGCPNILNLQNLQSLSAPFLPHS